mmetsp:Transcript_32659/g.29542  ORF Transcript_32659/g.29542 Transcript_32659/m.29542 type:complete len:152 (-) Transcript_32659:98-553(-)|eukprot:CAMPEP_0114583864 /NCGR_PEP_ID=MMETSP0125-20121206/7545_1 /TAXON_ID=485358 ORGANISM="Aristerostoma sp., Strain ATCC 50986" /NCGR_SAMPLE_ID=MMETSP0125 /ASSEMBLY_ACC=CAM_ASM_000245 /LENGTH=151 /DNA_ID=CAMNT_0001777643 /DNA_START=452 /DNA_END=907 /DNA_ORIENTATION=-
MNELNELEEKILYFSYQLVNPVISELFEAKCKCFEGFGENYRVFKNISEKLDDMEETYLTALNTDMANDDKRVLRTDTMKTVAKRAALLKATKTQNNKDIINPFQELEEFSLEGLYATLKNVYSLDTSSKDYAAVSSDVDTTSENMYQINS